MGKTNRAAYVVVAVLIGHVVLIFAQVTMLPGTRLLEGIAFGTLAEGQRLVAGTVGAVQTAWQGYVGLRGVRETNRDLRAEVDQLRLRLQQQHALVEQARGLERLLELRESIDLDTLSARVIGADATPWFRTLTVDRGSSDHVHEDLAVIAPPGVVGRIVGRPGFRVARVNLLIDRNAAAGAMIERTRGPGIVVGLDDLAQLRMDYVSNLEDVKVGDRVVTSGAEGIYPAGFAIGTVVETSRGSGLYRTIRVAPAVDFTRVAQVLIVMDGAGDQLVEGLR